MTVKTIFKVLIGSIVVPSCGFVLVESYNLMAVSNQVQNMEKVAAREACALFVQESYSRLQPPDNLLYSDGTVYYDTKDNFMATMFRDPVPSQYCQLDYSNPSSPKPPVYVQNWMKKYIMEPTSLGNGFGKVNTVVHSDADVTMKLKDVYYSGQLLESAYKHTVANDWDTTLAGAKITDWNAANVDDQIQYNIDMSRANNYANLYYTPANVGIPYIHEGAASSIFEYNLAALFSEYNPDRLRNYYYSDMYSNTDAGSTVSTGYSKNGYVAYKGWQIYTNQSLIYDVTYDTYDIRTDRGKKKLQAVTSVDADNIIANIKPEYKANGSVITDPYYVTVAHVNYVVPVRYEGVTPLKRVIAWLVNEKRVVGIGDSGNLDSGGSAPPVSNTVDVDYSNKYYEEINSVEKKTSDSAYAKGAYPTSGELYFTLIY